jgi:hypothetical protein
VDVGLISHELPYFGGKAGAASLTFRCLGNRLAGGLGAGHSPAPRELVERPSALSTKS